MYNAFHNLLNAIGAILLIALDWIVGVVFQAMDMNATNLKGLSLVLWLIALICGIGILIGLAVGLVLVILAMFGRTVTFYRGWWGYRLGRVPYFVFGGGFYLIGWICAILLVKVGVR